MRDLGNNPHHIYENLVTAVYSAALSEGDGFIDVGANVGHHTWQMAGCVGATGKGYAVEAIPSLADQVRRLLEIKEMPWVHVENVAVADEPGEADFYFRHDFTGWSSLFEGHVHPKDQGETEVFRTRIETLDRLLETVELPPITCMKLDIEHSEFNALRGGRATIDAHRPVIVFENSPYAAATINGYDIGEFFDWFDALDYRLFNIFFDVFDRAVYDGTRPIELPVYYVALPQDHPGLNAEPAEYFGVTETLDRLLGPENAASQS